MAKLAIPRLRFFLKGQAQHVFPLYELIFNNTLGIALANSPADPHPLLLDKRSVQAVGFEREQGVLPYSTRSFLGYRLLTEYFAFPQKFLFFDLAGLSPGVMAAAGSTLEVFFYLDRSTQDLEQNVSADTFQLGCTPVVNLYRQLAEPISLSHTETEYRVVPDTRRPLAAEVYGIERVTATSPANETIEYQPFYSIKHARSEVQRQAFWYATRRPAEQGDRGGDRGTEVFLSLVDLGFTPFAPADWTLSVETTCLNRDLPHRLPFGGGQPKLGLAAGGPLARVECLTRPTATLRPSLRRGALWRLISHLSLNHLSLADHEEGADALREILKLYDFADSAQTRSIIGGVLSIHSRRVVGRTGETGSGFCRGIELAVHFDEERFAGNGVFLFAAVLERFLGLYASINSFSRLVATTSQREGELRRWSPRAGETVLL
jgi:type VI secretion system protein ImpG